MSSGPRINVVSSTASEFNSNITVDNVVYHVQTEDSGRKTCRIVSSVYRQGEVLFTTKSDYSHLLRLENPDGRIRRLMEDQHKAVIDNFIKEHTPNNGSSR